MSELHSSNLKDVEKAALQKELQLYTNLLLKQDKRLQESKRQAIKQYNSKSFNIQHSSVVNRSYALLPRTRYATCNKYVKPKSVPINNSSVTDKKKVCDKFKSQFYSAGILKNSSKQIIPTKHKINILPHLLFKAQANSQRLLLFDKTSAPFENNTASLQKTSTCTSLSNLKDNTKTIFVRCGENKHAKPLQLNTKNIVINGAKTIPSKKDIFIKANSQKLKDDIEALTLLLEKHSSKNKNLPLSTKDKCDLELRKTLSVSDSILPVNAVKDGSCKDKKTMMKLLNGKLGNNNSSIEVPNILKVKVAVRSDDKSKADLSSTPLSSKMLNSSLNVIRNSKSSSKARTNHTSVKSKSSMDNKLRAKPTVSLMKKVAESNQASLTKIEKTLKVLQSKTVLPKSNAKLIVKPVGSTRKKATDNKLIASKYKVVNKRYSCVRAVKSKLSPKTYQKVGNTSLLKKDINLSKSIKKGPFKTPTLTMKLSNSKYRIVNKAKTPAEKLDNFSSPYFVINSRKQTPLSKKKKLNAYTCVNKNTYLNKSTPVKLAGLKSISKHKPLKLLKHNISNSSTWKITTNVHSKFKSPASSKYRFISKSNAHEKYAKVLRSSSIKSSSFDVNDMDVDLLLELAEERKIAESKKKVDKNMLLKRIFKSKRTIVNKNINSAQTKVAKMIKTKYSIFNKKKVWQKNVSPKNFRRHLQYKGYMPHSSFQRKINTLPFYNQRNRGNPMYRTHVSRTYQSSHRSNKNIGSMLHYKTPNRVVTRLKVISKTNHSELKHRTPISKVIASRVLHRSINRALSASTKKKLSKNNVYCMFYNRFGRCNKGLKCSYIHDPRRIAVCTRYLRGTCKIENCPFSHEINPGKMAICSFFLLGSCTKINCPYRHETLSPDSKLCKAFVQGYCPGGKDCKNAHVLVCPQYIQGCCEKGKDCPFPHPPSKDKKNLPKVVEKQKMPDPQSDVGDLLVEKVSRYFQPSSEKTDAQVSVGNSVVPRRAKLDEQPSFIALSFNDSL